MVILKNWAETSAAKEDQWMDVINALWISDFWQNIQYTKQCDYSVVQE